MPLPVPLSLFYRGKVVVENDSLSPPNTVRKKRSRTSRLPVVETDGLSPPNKGR
jgi:hypothetical protein